MAPLPSISGGANAAVLKWRAKKIEPKNWDLRSPAGAIHVTSLTKDGVGNRGGNLVLSSCTRRQTNSATLKTRLSLSPWRSIWDNLAL